MKYFKIVHKNAGFKKRNLLIKIDCVHRDPYFLIES